MASGDGKSSASEDYEVPLSGNKRELDKTAEEKWERRKAGDPAAPAPSSTRPSAKLKRSRMEYAAMDRSDPVRTKDLDLGAALADDYPHCFHNQLPEETLPMRHQQVHRGAQFCNPGGLNHLEEIDVPSLKEATAGGAGDVGSLGVQVLDATVESLLDATVESLIDSGKLLRVSNQVPSTRTFSIKVYAHKSTVKISWGQESV